MVSLALRWVPPKEACAPTEFNPLLLASELLRTTSDECQSMEPRDIRTRPGRPDMAFIGANDAHSLSIPGF